MANLAFPKCWKISSKPHNYCPGCGYPLLYKALGWNIDELKIQPRTFLGIDIGCALLAWDFFNIDTMQTHHGRTIPVAVGLKKARPEAVGIAVVGDGGAYAIGLQHLISARLRNDPITVIVINNSVYGMTADKRRLLHCPVKLLALQLLGLTII
jgi:2-oxoglutarate ferredoxin oxidoreductase subunit beta